MFIFITVYTSIYVPVKGITQNFFQEIEVVEVYHMEIFGIPRRRMHQQRYQFRIFHRFLDGFSWYNL